eukprot:GHVP01049819.1.p1 GENE.GHVP01049819.1~~GHVP01049819.1.p1  ORF type:complete len:112 (+),score=17.82 GHVP01049819.1:493-828(+)
MRTFDFDDLKIRPNKSNRHLIKILFTISSKSQSDAEKKLLWILLFMDGKISVSDTDEICTSLCKNAIDWRKKICNLCLKGKFWKSGSLNLKMAELLLIAFRRVRRGKQIST